MARPFALSLDIRRGDIPHMTEKLLNLSAQLSDSFARALKPEGDGILKQAKINAPFRTGRLYRSGRSYQSSPRKPRVNVQFLVRYALAVEMNHPTKAHFLGRARDAALPGMSRRILRRMLKDLR